jgi:hypothetical protein
MSSCFPGQSGGHVPREPHNYAAFQTFQLASSAVAARVPCRSPCGRAHRDGKAPVFRDGSRHCDTEGVLWLLPYTVTVEKTTINLLYTHVACACTARTSCVACRGRSGTGLVVRCSFQRIVLERPPLRHPQQQALNALAMHMSAALQPPRSAPGVRTE